jgi:hypothetical protein
MSVLYVTSCLIARVRDVGVALGALCLDQGPMISVLLSSATILLIEKVLTVCRNLD